MDLETANQAEREALARKLKPIVEQLQEMGETDMGCLDMNRAGRFHYAVEMLQNLHGFLVEPKDLPTPKAIALKFADILEQELGQEVLSKIIKRNRKYRLEGKTKVCASHEFCDANMVMAAAFKEFGFPDVVGRDDLKPLWNAAWEYAVAAEFFQGFAKHFPEFDVFTMPPIPTEWDDTSSPNDSCPSFRTYRGHQVFIDYADPSMRESIETVRFTVHDDIALFDESQIVFPTDDWEMLILYVKEGPTKYTMKRIEELADDAHVQDEDDYGSKRQIDAENRFFYAVEALGVDVSEYETSKMTSDERIDDALAKVKERFA